MRLYSEHEPLRDSRSRRGTQAARLSIKRRRSPPNRFAYSAVMMFTNVHVDCQWRKEAEEGNNWKVLQSRTEVHPRKETERS